MQDKAETARRLLYGDDVEAMDLDHDRIHAWLCDRMGVPSYSLMQARGEPMTEQQYALAAYEEDAVLMVQRLMRAHGVKVVG